MAAAIHQRLDAFAENLGAADELIENQSTPARW